MYKLKYRGVTVLTTAQIASVLGTPMINIQNNFKNNRRRFEEGKHYFKLEGAELNAAKMLLGTGHQSKKTSPRSLELIETADMATLVLPEPTMGKRSSSLMLWTKRGLLNHVKSVNTDKAWSIYETMEEVYFTVLEGRELLSTPEMPQMPKPIVVTPWYWHGKPVLLIRDLVQYLNITRDAIKDQIQRYLKTSEWEVLNGARLREFKLENHGQLRLGKSFLIVSWTGVQKLFQFNRMEMPVLTQEPTTQLMLFDADVLGLTATIEATAEGLMEQAAKLLEMNAALQMRIAQ